MPFLCRGILLFLLCSYSGAAQTPQDSTGKASPTRGQRAVAQEYLRLAQQYVRTGQTTEAQHLLSQAIAIRHDLTEAYLLRADLKRSANDLAGAIVDYSVAVYQQPEHYEARFQRATTQYDAQRYAAAREDFEYLLDHPTGETNTIYFKGAPASGEFVASGITTLQSDIQSDLLNYIGLCYWHTQNFAQARTHFERAIAYRPEEPMAYANLGLTYEAAGDTLHAIEHYQRALEIAPQHPVALRNLSSLARKLNDTALAEKIMSEDSPPSYDALLQRGMFQHEQGLYQEAIASFSQALALSPHRTEALIQRGFAYEKASLAAQALNDYTQAINLDPQAGKAYSNRGNIHFRQGQYAAALADYNQALALDADNAIIWHNRGLVHYRLGHQGAACEDLHQSLAIGYSAAAKPLKKICSY